MTHTFTTREKILLLILVIMLLGVAYYFAIQIPVSDRILTAQNAEATATDEMSVETVKATKMKKMQAVIDGADSNSSKAEIPVYDNLEKVMLQLDAILGTTIDYSLTFDQISKGDSLVYRPINMSFTCPNYSAAKSVLANLNNCKYRCMLDNISVATTTSLSPDISNGEVMVSLTVTFIEKIS